MKIGWHRRLAHRLGYDLNKFNKQVTVETHLRELLPRLNIDLVLDVGANQGQYAESLRYLGYQGRILSFEPSRTTFETLAQAAEADPLWQAFPFALGDVTGDAALHVSGHSVFNSLHAPNEYGESRFGKSIQQQSTEQVQVERLDQFLNQHVPDFDQRRVFLKMDTQGHDKAVFAGAGDFAGRFHGLQSEISVMPIYEGIPDYIECLNEYRSSGYEVTGLFTIHRNRTTGHVIEFDCVMAPRAADAA